MHHHLRRVSALAAAALTAGALTLTTTGSAGATPAPTDPAPYAAAKAWLLQQVQSGLVGGDPGATADAVVQLHLAGDDSDAHTLAEALIPQVDAYAGAPDATNVTSLGAVVTALLNSSTITTVLMVGFVSAGLMTLTQSVPMIMGANIGSTVTAQIIAFDVSRLAPFMLAAGFIMYAFGKRMLIRRVGEVVMGLGLLFIGIQFMGDATRPLRTFPPFIDAMQNMEHPLLGIVVGAVFTAIVQRTGSPPTNRA